MTPVLTSHAKKENETKERERERERESDRARERQKETMPYILNSSIFNLIFEIIHILKSAGA